VVNTESISLALPIDGCPENTLKLTKVLLGLSIKDKNWAKECACATAFLHLATVGIAKAKVTVYTTSFAYEIRLQNGIILSGLVQKGDDIIQQIRQHITETKIAS
jgi:hypothetical protein